MDRWDILRSTQDRSVNHLSPTQDGGLWEARLVQRRDDYLIAYLSSHTGCNYSCRFCHLTATGQTTFTPATLTDYLEQAGRVLETYSERVQTGEQPAAKLVHYNFMARGEPLANPTLVKQANVLFYGLQQLALIRELRARFLISSIIPAEFEGPLNQVFAHPDSVLYYSLYSINPEFRKRWLPKAMDPLKALQLIKQYQDTTGRRIVLHWAFIEGQNDSLDDLERTLDAVEDFGIRAKFNLVRYNPYSDRLGREPDEQRLEQLFEIVQQRLGETGSRIVPRVGFDVKASCGMFVHDRQT